MRRVPEGGLVVLALTGLAVWMTWPIAAHLGTHVYDPAAISRGLPGYVHPDIHLTAELSQETKRQLRALGYLRD